LQEKWWERHFRGFEAGLPSKLIQNLLPIFIENEETSSFDDELVKAGNNELMKEG